MLTTHDPDPTGGGVAAAADHVRFFVLSVFSLERIDQGSPPPYIVTDPQRG